MDDDSNTLIIPSLPQYLITEEQERLLRAKLVNHQDNNFSVEHYVLARAFINSCHSSYLFYFLNRGRNYDNHN